MRWALTLLSVALPTALTAFAGWSPLPSPSITIASARVTSPAASADGFGYNYCTSCGNPVGDWQFCANCGAPLDAYRPRQPGPPETRWRQPNPSDGYYTPDFDAGAYGADAYGQGAYGSPDRYGNTNGYAQQYQPPGPFETRSFAPGSYMPGAYRRELPMPPIARGQLGTGSIGGAMRGLGVPLLGGLLAPPLFSGIGEIARRCASATPPL
jgi:hypothetical protein